MVMTNYDNNRGIKYNNPASDWARFFFDSSVPCPYGLEQKAVYKQGLLGGISTRILETFLDLGYRRNGNYIYTMVCPDCCGCVPVRIVPVNFKPNRNQKRVFKKNLDITTDIVPIHITDEKLELCDKFLQARYPGRNNSAEEYYSSFFLCTGGYTYEFEYRVAEKLIGVGIIDLCGDVLNCVYCYFDPAEGRRSLGTFNILSGINFCQQHKINLIYLGYWIKQIKAMSYKANFKPHSLLVDGEWISVNRG